MIQGYKILDKIGSGTHGKVYKLEKDNKYYAGKLFRDIERNQFSHDFLNEINIISQLEHSSIIKYHEIIIEKDQRWMIMDLYESSYNHYIKSFSFLYKLACGLEYLHICKIIHRDIKPGNILLDSEENPIICDFGNSIVNRKNEILTTEKEITTLNFKAPELWLDKHYDYKIDVWSLGVAFLRYFDIYDLQSIAVELREYTGDYLDLNHFQKNYNQEKIDDLINNKFHRILADLLIGMLQIDPKKRLSSSDVVNHLFFKNYQREPIIYKKLYYRYLHSQIEEDEYYSIIPLDAIQTSVEILNKYIAIMHITNLQNTICNCISIALKFHNYDVDDYINSSWKYFKEQKEILEKINYQIFDI